MSWEQYLFLIIYILLCFSAYTLKCFDCPLESAGTCTQSQCPASNYQCAAIRTVAYAGGSKLSDITRQSCVLPEECLSGSINFGVARTVINSTCCATDLCNNQTATDISNTGPNGNKCFTCDVNQCKETLNCEGSEDHCIKVSVTQGSVRITVKGCVSKAFCLQSSSTIGSTGTDISCCQGDYCNSSISTRAGLLLLVAPLIYFIVFF
ncbi:urokinase plasminogen activator surface receptor-like [Betta splendens]|uniref:Urokinase plasminogen activator surface receptor-like n=1 Tax=Betta splendens TaxID=158456 RepID=A0A9W2XCB4_BETSP|nr:urokinase plasminogen activator surface receptor-like [Betta splendens]